MIQNQKKLLELIPGDNLHYTKYGWNVYSEEEIESMVFNCLNAGVPEDDVHHFIQEAVLSKLSDLLIERVNKGELTFSVNDEDETMFDFKPIL